MNLPLRMPKVVSFKFMSQTKSLAEKGRQYFKPIQITCLVRQKTW